MKYLGNKWLITDFINSKNIIAFNNLVFSGNSHSVLSEIQTNNKYNPHFHYGDHLLYFNPVNIEQDADGYYSYLSPSKNFFSDKEDIIGYSGYKRRMWTQGKITFPQPLPSQLNFEMNKTYQCLEKIKYVKILANNAFINIEREIYPCLNDSSFKPSIQKLTDDEYNSLSTKNVNNMVVKETRMLMYTNELYNSNCNNYTNRICGTNEKLLTSPQSIRKYSEITNNPHRIHLDAQYCWLEEKLPDVIMHGPFSIQLILRNFIACHPNLNIKSIDYKNRNPIFANANISFEIKPVPNRSNIYQSNIINTLDSQILVESKIHVEKNPCV
ncbi:uncharacterized protein SCODWIG_03003 [Saccharomycodes ludwigii]|uniref:Hydroxyacyl-thioester dehydratase type 2, mitochondrial n=1 Tax=Saccharomycodes ludwigii TaxID=36035 RepID=A0A376B9B2_9ASCO|nr:hypothetical protein SCDLUD_004652 [Saccharomycodes ludwigii]KAH3899220.1 hypothetical protein SCDLUD_004652 [Saccharomycodes ludwigii]SSD61242.1 uncharacterized protein SCODWIG_03003 [Saccharomycodes ludwigii]